MDTFEFRQRTGAQIICDRSLTPAEKIRAFRHNCIPDAEAERRIYDAPHEERERLRHELRVATGWYNARS